jgi:uncharacterized protein YndB with AHSA1/START domain
MTGETKDAAAVGRAVTGEVEIDASIDRVWQALTDADELMRWFPLEARVEPGAGGSIFMSWKNEFAGTSEVLDWEAPRLLRTTWGELDNTNGPLQVTEYRLESLGAARTLLRVVTSGFPTDAAWDEWVEGTRLGWLVELRSLRHYLERHDGEDRRVVYVRRRVTLPAAEAWSRLMGDDGLDARWRRGDVVADEPGRVLATLPAEVPGALLRASIEPCNMQPGEDARDVTLWLAAWGAAAAPERMAAIDADWRGMLERLFPAGRTV